MNCPIGAIDEAAEGEDRRLSTGPDSMVGCMSADVASASQATEPASLESDSGDGYSSDSSVSEYFDTCSSPGSELGHWSGTTVLPRYSLEKHAAV